MRVLNTLFNTVPAATMSALFHALQGGRAPSPQSDLGGGIVAAAGGGVNGGPVPPRVKEEILNVVIRSILYDSSFQVEKCRLTPG
jgi:hypothetical protein